MLRHGWLLIGIVGLPLAFPLAGGPGSEGVGDRASWQGGFRLSMNPPVPDPVDPVSMDEQQWKYIIDLLCIIIPCSPTDPDAETIESATACLHARLDRFESEGLNPDLDQPTIEAWIANIDVLIAILSGPNWDVFVQDTEERDVLLGQLGSLKDALEMELPAARSAERE